MIPPALVQRCAEAAYTQYPNVRLSGLPVPWSELSADGQTREEFLNMARAMLEIALPAIEAAAYERAAECCEANAKRTREQAGETGDMTNRLMHLRAARAHQQSAVDIRALAPKPHHPSKGDEG